MTSIALSAKAARPLHRPGIAIFSASNVNGLAPPTLQFPYPNVASYDGARHRQKQS